MATRVRTADHLEETASPKTQVEALQALVRQSFQEKASDVHLRSGSPPRIRIDGELLQVKGFTPAEEGMRQFFGQMLSEEKFRLFDRNLELDFSHVLPGVCRIRANLYQERGKFCASLRLIPEAIPSMEEIGLSPAVMELTQLDRGLVLVTGPTGCGKSTTLAAMINHINATRRCHILTIEDPIEYDYEEKRAMISQRELDRDTRTFAAALRHSFRQDPDVVLIGEMRDLETMQTAITLAETGHLTFSTLHTGYAAQTINRIIDVMPAHQRDQIRVQLSNSLSAVISQKLLPRLDGKGRIAAREVMICNRAVRNLIREGKTNQIASAMQTGVEEGMALMDAALAELVNSNLVDPEIAKLHSDDPKDLQTKFRRV
jgi:twitching motility protein PilT